MSLNPNNNNSKEWLDHYFYKIGVNVVPANSKNKRPIIPYKQYLNNHISSDLFESWKNENKFKDGFIIILGKIWRGINEGKYIIGIDIDKELGIKEFCTIDGKTITLKEFGNTTVVEQHIDDLAKAHVYYISPIPFPLKSSDTILGIEVKKYIVPAPNIHKNGNRYEIIGDKKEPSVLNQTDAYNLIRHIDTICRKYGLKYADLQNNKRSQEIRKMIKSCSINPEIIIEEGERHTILLSIANSLLINHIKSKNFNGNEKIIRIQQLQDFFFEINTQLCKPIPLPEKEINEIWTSAVNYVINIKNKQITSFKDNEENLVEKASEYLLGKFHFLTLETTKEIFYYENGFYKKDGENNY